MRKLQNRLFFSHNGCDVCYNKPILAYLRRMYHACVCPECGHRCSACLGTNTVVSREQLKNLAAVRWINQDIDRARDALAGKDTDEEDEP